MSLFRRKSLWITVLLLLLAGVVLRAAVPEWGRRELLSRLRDACPACRFEMRELELGIFSGRAVARGVGFLGDPKDGTHFGATAQVLTVDVRLSSLWKGVPWINNIRIDGLDLVVGDYFNSPPNTRPPSYPFLSTLPAVHLEGLQVRDSKFMYVLDPPEQQHIPNGADIPDTVSVAEALRIKKHYAFLPFHSIDADFGPIGTKQEISPDFVKAMATARQGKTAQVRVAVRLGLFEEEKMDDIEIWAGSAELSEIDTMFVPAEGIAISGYLREGHAKLDVRKRKLQATVSLAYNGLKVHYLKGHPGRSGLKTFISNVVSGAMVDKKKRADDSEGKASATVSVEQKPFDNVFTFLVDGLREAIKKIISSG